MPTLIFLLKKHSDASTVGWRLIRLYFLQYLQGLFAAVQSLWGRRKVERGRVLGLPPPRFVVQLLRNLRAVLSDEVLS